MSQATAAVMDLLSGGLTSAARLYHLGGDAARGGLLVETWCQREALNEPWRLELSALSLRPDLDLDALLGRRLDLRTILSDGSDWLRSGLVTEAAAEESDGGFARYRLVVEPWLALLAHTRRSQVWQEKTLVEIVDSVFARYAARASWRWAEGVDEHLLQSAFSGSGGQRSYTVQYRETDLRFVQRLLAEEGLVLRFEPDDGAPDGQTLVILADTVDPASCPEDRCSSSAPGGAGIRFHRDAQVEEQDVVLALGALRHLPIARASALAWDYKGKRAIAADVATLGSVGGDNTPRLEAYDAAGAYAFPSPAQAERALVLAQQAHEARHKTWLGRGTVRSFSAGTQFTLTESTLDVLAALGAALQGASGGGERRFLLTSVVHAGINNLPKHDNQTIVRALGEGGADLLPAWVPDEVKRQAAASGYGNAFEAIRASVPWRPVLVDEHGRRLNPKPTVDGPQVATVVGPAGQEIHMDALGRIRIRHDFQTQPGAGPDTSDSSTWVRVLQRHAGAGMGLQFIPRIGQQVLVDFVDGDIDRPLVVGALYDGRGEGGIATTPGGQPGESDTSVFAQSSDHRPSAQGNLAGGGHSPAWHGASAGDATPGGGQRNAAALSGWKTQEFSGPGYNQLVFDDSNNQLRLQLMSTQHGTQLNLGHLIHQADNHRGSFRGLGFELRSDAYGSLRAGAGLVLSSYGEALPQAAGDLAAAIALAKQLEQCGQAMSRAATLHQTVPLAAHIGSHQANQSLIDAQAAPLKALRTVVSGMVDETAPERAAADAAAKCNAAGATKVPQLTDPVIALAAKAGLAVTAGQDLQWSAGETITTMSGQDTQFAVGGDARLHTGQAIGVLAGAVGPGDEAAGKGLTLIAAKKDLEVQAQSDRMQLAAQKDVLVESERAHVDVAAAKKISLSVAGGANITIEGGNIVVQCPGTITVLAGHKSFLGASRVAYTLPRLPKVVLPPAGPYVGRHELFKLDNRPFEGYAYEVRDLGRRVLAQGLTDEAGFCEWVQTERPTAVRAYKSIMRESERITEDWQSKLDAAAARATGQS
ncbi:type VI secretion system Vgr family protein [Aquabacterium humicola]|uniref:type VI secretion system Vgr family protein n=1 Tax=Aquabacterium humicola TaxID=3237377 RepID=UPI002543A903|nr:type VI secretion system Vgr family protein [Rubrivivax pictus]